VYLLVAACATTDSFRLGLELYDLGHATHSLSRAADRPRASHSEIDTPPSLAYTSLLRAHTERVACALCTHMSQGLVPLEDKRGLGGPLARILRSLPPNRAPAVHWEISSAPSGRPSPMYHGRGGTPLSLATPRADRPPCFSRLSVRLAAGCGGNQHEMRPGSFDQRRLTGVQLAAGVKPLCQLGGQSFSIDAWLGDAGPGPHRRGGRPGFDSLPAAGPRRSAAGSLGSWSSTLIQGRSWPNEQWQTNNYTMYHRLLVTGIGAFPRALAHPSLDLRILIVRNPLAPCSPWRHRAWRSCAMPDFRLAALEPPAPRTREHGACGGLV